MIEVEIFLDELKGIHHPDEYVKNRLRKAGIPITGLFNPKSSVKNGQLTKHTLTENVVKYVWSE
jgi:hypothetical protein